MTALMNKFKCLTTLTLTFCMLQLKFLSLFALMSIHNNFIYISKLRQCKEVNIYKKNSRTRAHFCSPTNFVCFWSAAKRKHKHERNFFYLFWKWKFSQYSRPSNVFLLLLLHVVVDVLRSIECDFFRWYLWVTQHSNTRRRKRSEHELDDEKCSNKRSNV